MPELVRVLPKALKYGLENFFENRNYVIEDILALNPDVKLLVIGMFEAALKMKRTSRQVRRARRRSTSVSLLLTCQTTVNPKVA